MTMEGGLLVFFFGVLFLSISCSRCVVYMFCSCSLRVLYIFYLWSLHVLTVLSVFCQCSLACALPVPSRASTELQCARRTTLTNACRWCFLRVLFVSLCVWFVQGKKDCAHRVAMREKKDFYEWMTGRVNSCTATFHAKAYFGGALAPEA